MFPNSTLGGSTSGLKSIIANPSAPNHIPSNLQSSPAPITKANVTQNPNTSPGPTPPPTSAPAPNPGTNSATGLPNNSPQLADLINTAYNQKISSIQDLINGLGARQSGLNQEIGNQYDSERATLDTGHAQTLRDITQGITQLNAYHDNTLRNLGIGNADQANGLNNKVGVMTPYNNSATQVIATALAQLLGRQTGDVNQQYGFQQTGFNNKQNDAETGYKNGVNSLDVWKNNNLSDIARNVSDYGTQLNSQINDANQNRDLTLANMANYAGNSGLLGDVAQLQANYNPNNVTYNPLDHATVASALQAFQNVPQVQQFNVPAVNTLS